MKLWWRLVCFGFHLLYNELAWTYDLVSWVASLGQWRSWQQTSISYLDGAHEGWVLELAHGTGDLQIDLARSGILSIGLDLSAHMGRITRRKMHGDSLPHRLVQANAMKLPFQADTFSALISTFPTEFIVHPHTLGEVYRVLRPDGRLVVVPIGILTLKNLSARFIEWLYHITGQRGPWPDKPLQIFREAGFEAKLVVEELSSSQVWLVVAQKPDSRSALYPK